MEALNFKNRAKNLDTKAAHDAALSLGGIQQESGNSEFDKYSFGDSSFALVSHTTPVNVKAYDEHGIAQLESQLFADAQGNLVEVVEGMTDADVVSFAAQGGGFLYKLTRAEFEARFKPAEEPGFKLVAISAEWLPEGMAVPAYTTGKRWNGWAMPSFTFEAASSLLPYMPDLRYDAEADAFCAQLGDDEEELYVFKAEYIDVDGKQTKVYAVGAGCWCWDLRD